MPGKYSKLKGTLEQAPGDLKHLEKVAEKSAELELTSKTPAELAIIYTKAYEEKDRLEELQKEQQLILDATSQLMVAELEGSGISKITLDNGDTFYIKDSPYCSVENKTEWLAWIRETKQEELLSVHYKTMEAIAVNRLLKGEKLPPGIKAFINSKIVRLPGRNK